MTWTPTTKTRRELGQRGRLCAAELLRRLRIQAVDEIDIECIAFHHGLRVRYGGLAGAQGRLTSTGKRGFIRVADNITQEQRRRFIVAHELGHHLVHTPNGQVSLCTDSDLLRYEAAAGNLEVEANWFAAAVLMPEQLFKAKCDVRQPSLAIVRGLAAQFNTTLTATAIRFIDLCPEACAVVWSESGAIKWAIRGPDFWPSIQFGRKLGTYTHAADAFRGNAPPDGPQIVPAHAWTSKSGGDIYEDTAWFRGLNATLTVLWLPSDQQHGARLALRAGRRLLRRGTDLALCFTHDIRGGGFRGRKLKQGESHGPLPVLSVRELDV